MTVTIVETRSQARDITTGVGTHADVHVAAALDHKQRQRCDDRSIPPTVLRRF
jgi:hypothetical protein